jgi:hypothetical protein
MSVATLILGESGTGKSTSMRNLDASQALLIQSIRKPLPFKSEGWKRRVKDATTGLVTGNVVTTDDALKIEALMRGTAFPIIVLDDFQYVLANEFMRRSAERGFDKFTDIGRNAWNLMSAAAQLPEDKRVYILSHVAVDEAGRTKMKTIGKLLDEKITPEGMFTICLKTMVQDGNYLFATQNNGADTVKSPMAMFTDAYIPNDLAEVDAAICDYYGIGVAA